MSGHRSAQSTAVSSQLPLAMSHHHDFCKFHKPLCLLMSLLLYANLFLIFTQQVLYVLGCLRPLDKFLLPLAVFISLTDSLASAARSRLQHLFISFTSSALVLILYSRRSSLANLACTSLLSYPLTSASRINPQEPSIIFSSH